MLGLLRGMAVRPPPTLPPPRAPPPSTRPPPPQPVLQVEAGGAALEDAAGEGARDAARLRRAVWRARERTPSPARPPRATPDLAWRLLQQARDEEAARLLRRLALLFRGRIEDDLVLSSIVSFARR